MHYYLVPPVINVVNEGNEEGERIRLPLILPCGHGVCYDCVMEKKNVVAYKICCPVCNECYPISKLENTLRDPLRRTQQISNRLNSCV